MENLRIHDTFKYKERVTLGEATTQSFIIERIEKLKQLVNAYNFDEEPITLRLFGDITSGLGFTLECDNKITQQRINKALKMYLSNCSD